MVSEPVMLSPVLFTLAVSSRWTSVIASFQSLDLMTWPLDLGNGESGVKAMLASS
jgi:hypothetical protein